MLKHSLFFFFFFFKRQRTQHQRGQQTSDIIMGKSLATTGRVLLASLFLFAGAHKYHALDASSTIGRPTVGTIARPEIRGSESGDECERLVDVPVAVRRRENNGRTTRIDDATVAMIGTVIELLGAVLLMFTSPWEVNC